MIKLPKKNKRKPKESEELHEGDENGRAMSWWVSYFVKGMRALNSHGEMGKSRVSRRNGQMISGLRRDL